MSKVIKNNDGVAVVEGTPAASLVKDVDKFFASKPPERMAGESISQPKKIGSVSNFLDFYNKQSSPLFDGKGNVIGYKDGTKGTTEMFDKPIPKEEYKGPDQRAINTKSPIQRKPDPRAINTKSPIQRKPDPRAINTKSPIPKKPQSERTDEERRANLEAFDRLSEERKRGITINTKRPQSNRNEAKEKAESRRKRFFERRRSRKEAERSQTEQEATQGKFITTLKR